MIDVKKVEDFEKLTTSLEDIATAIENMPAPAGGGVNYSTDEQDTGLLWIDGRHVYQRTFDRTTTALNDRNWNTNILGTSDIQIIDVNMFLNFDSYPPILPQSYHRSSVDYLTWQLMPNQSDIQIRPEMQGVTLYAGIITIKYVKVGE